MLSGSVTGRLIAKLSATLVEDGKDVEGVEDAGLCSKLRCLPVRALTNSGSLGFGGTSRGLEIEDVEDGKHAGPSLMLETPADWNSSNQGSSQELETGKSAHLRR